MLKTKTLILFVLLSQTAIGQSMLDSIIHIPEVEISAESAFKKEEAGMKETHIDSTLLSIKTNNSLSDILSENTTVYIKNYGRGALSTASFRGTAVSHTQVSWNGININSPMSGIVDFSLIPLYIVDEMSLQHGASSIPYQSGGLGGHISIGSTVNWNNRFSGRYYQGAGSYSSFDEFGQINFGNKGFQSKSRFYHSYSKNNYSYKNTSLIEEPDQQLEGGNLRTHGGIGNRGKSYKSTAITAYFNKSKLQKI